MQFAMQHWLALIVVLAIGYAIGARKPNLVPYIGAG